MARKAKKEASDAAKRYFAEASAWDQSRAAAAERSKNVAWAVASVSMMIALGSVIAVAGLTPLKETQPFLIRVDNTTGVVDTIDRLTDAKTNYQETINKYFVSMYVRHREAFDRNLAEYRYNAVGLMSNRPVQQAYYDWFNPKNNPNSPLRRYRRSEKVQVTIKSVSFVSKDTALVRFVREETGNNQKTLASHWVATVAFTYENPPTKQTEREINPLGFQVTSYRIDPESGTGAAIDIRDRIEIAPADAPAPPAFDARPIQEELEAGAEGEASNDEGNSDEPESDGAKDE